MKYTKPNEMRVFSGDGRLEIHKFMRLLELENTWDSQAALM